MAPMQARKDRYLGRSVERSRPSNTYISEKKIGTSLTKLARYSLGRFQKIGRNCKQAGNSQKKKRKREKKEKASARIREAK